MELLTSGFHVVSRELFLKNNDLEIKKWATARNNAN
jgi:hypothetical protein